MSSVCHLVCMHARDGAGGERCIYLLCTDMSDGMRVEAGFTDTRVLC